MAIIGKNLNMAAELLGAGELVAIPTETVYGLAGNALNKDAISKIYSAKNRPATNPLILHISDINQLKKHTIKIPDMALKLAEKFWPGPLTLLFEKSNNILPEITSGLNTVAIRIPNHPLTLDLLNKISFPLVAPSANPYGYISPTSARHVSNQLGKKIKYILDGGDCERGIESTIVGFEKEIPIIYRKGIITPEDIKKITGHVQLHQPKSDTIITSGMSLSHYSPITPLYLSQNIDKSISSFSGKNIGLLVFCKKRNYVEDEKQVILSPKGSLEDAARNLYKALHYLDSLKLEAIIAETVPEEKIGIAINDRLNRASQK
jgi:L-threonylcarbamoyladenylate synthase